MSHTANAIHAKAFALVQIGFGTTFKTYSQRSMLQVQPGDLPVLAVHLLRERRVPDGQSNQAEPKFVHDITLGFSGAVHDATDQQNQIPALEEWMAALDDILLSDPSFVNLTEGITAMDCVRQNAKVGEITLFEIRVEMSVQSRSYFPPRVPDWFNTMHVESRYPTANVDPAQVQQVIVQYDVDETVRKKPN